MTLLKSFGKTATATLLVLTASTACVTVARAQATADFPDVPANHWAYQAVHQLADKGLVKGYPDGRFLGDRAMTRYEFATVIERLLETIADMKSGTPPPPAGVTPDDLNKIQVLVDKFQPQLDDIKADVAKSKADIEALRRNIADLRVDVQDAKDLAGKAQDTANNSYGFDLKGKRKFLITGYIQARYQQNQSGNQSDPTHLAFPHGKGASANPYNGSYGAGANGATFEDRRARIKFIGQVSSNTKYTIQIDTGANSAATPVSVREGHIDYTFNNGDPAHNPTFAIGIVPTSFGFMLPNSAANVISSEKPLPFNETGSGAIWANQDYDKGITLSQPFGRTKLLAGILSGVGYGANTGNDVDRAVDQLYRISYTGSSKVSGGLSLYNGHQPDAAGGGQGSKKQLAGADLQLTPTPNITLLGEWMGGTFEQRQYFAFGGTPAGWTLKNTGARSNKIAGSYVQGAYTFRPTGRHPFTLAASYDLLQRSRSGASATSPGGGSNATFDDLNFGYGVLYNLDPATRLRFWYIKPSAVAHDPASPQPDKIDLLTGEIQVKF